MKKRILTITVLSLALLLIFTGCGNEAAPEAPELPEETPAPTPEPTPAPEPTPPPFEPLSLQEQNRYYCAPHYFEHDGMIYSNFFDKDQKIHFGCVEKGKSQSEYVQLLDDPVSCCEFIDGKLFVLTCQCSDAALYRCSPDMSEMELLVSLPDRRIHDYAQYYDGYFYYSDNTQDYRYYRIPAEGGEPELILDKGVYYPLIHDGWLLYQDDADNESLHWMELESGDDCKINSSPACNAYLDGDYIYYEGKEQNPGIYRVKVDGSDEVQVCESDCCAEFGIDEKYIYFVKNEPDYYLFRMDKNGGIPEQLGTEIFNSRPYIMNGMIYLEHNSDTIKYFYAYKYLDAETGEYLKDIN